MIRSGISPSGALRPIREPYTAYLQGGLTYAHGKMALMRTADTIYKGRKED